MRTSKFYYYSIIFLIITACDKPIKNPESIDPVYIDIVASAEKTKKEIEAKQKEIDGYYINLDSQKNNFLDQKLTRQNIQAAEHDLRKLKQTEQFYRVSAESRQVFARKQYLEYYKKGLEWPPKDVGSAYKSNKSIKDNYNSVWSRGNKREIANSKK